MRKDRAGEEKGESDASDGIGSQLSVISSSPDIL